MINQGGLLSVLNLMASTGTTRRWLTLYEAPLVRHLFIMVKGKPAWDVGSAVLPYKRSSRISVTLGIHSMVYYRTSFNTEGTSIRIGDLRMYRVRI